MSCPGTDVLLFRQLSESSVNQHVAGWLGPWPPPERMAVVYRRGEVGAVCEVDRLTPDVMQRLAQTTMTLTYFHLESASQINEPAPVDAHWCRAAEYLPERAVE